MTCAKNYETMSKFVKVMPRILWPLVPGHGVWANLRKGMISQVANQPGRTKKPLTTL